MGAGLTGAEEGRGRPPARVPPADPGNELSPRWKKIEVLGRPVSAFFTALAVGAIGFFGQTALKDREAEITQRAAKHEEQLTLRAAKQQDMRLYTELMARREEADSGLRTEMFKAILSEFLADGTEGRIPISLKLLKLELLALNFGDSLSLSPLFVSVDKEIERPSVASGVPEAKQRVYRNRLRSLARRVSGAQLSALVPRGQDVTIQVPLKDVLPVGAKSPGSEPDGVYLWPDEIAELEAKANNKEKDEGWLERKRGELATRTLAGVTRSYEVEFSNADKDLGTVKVKLTITNDDDPADKQEVPFELNFFNFPMIDSTRLSHDQRFALVLEKFDTKLEHIVATGVIFPGSNASLRDKPFLNDIMERLQTEAEEEPAPEGAMP